MVVARHVVAHKFLEVMILVDHKSYHLMFFVSGLPFLYFLFLYLTQVKQITFIAQLNYIKSKLEFSSL